MTSVTFRNSPVRREVSGVLPGSHSTDHSHHHSGWGPVSSPKPPPLFSTDWFEQWMSRLHREFGKRSTFQIVIIAILFHSALSIFLIYAHLVYYSETYLSKHSAIHSHPNRGRIAVVSRAPLTLEDIDSELRFQFHKGGKSSFLDPTNETLFGPSASANLLSSKLIDARELTYIGWFSDHYRWEADRHQCWSVMGGSSNGGGGGGGRWTLCDKIFSARCNPDSIRAIYQFVPLKPSAAVRQLFFSVRATAEALTEQYASPAANNGANGQAEPFYGLMVLVEFARPTEDEPELLKLKFQYENDAWSLRTLLYDATKGKRRKFSPIVAVTLMVACFGYSGVASFADIRLTSSSVGLDPLYARHEVGSWCDYLFKPPPPLPKIPNQDSPKLLPHELLRLPKQQPAKQQLTHLVTFVSQLSLDRLPILERSLATWSGPVSLAIYIPLKGSTGAREEDQNLNDQDSPSSSSILDWQRLYINKKISALGGNISLAESTVALVPGQEGSDAIYPINGLRNLAMAAVKTKYAFLVDADFQPSPGLEGRFAAYLQRKEATKTVEKEEEEKVAYVVPAFEYLETPNRDDPIIKSKDELIQLVHREEPIVQPFRFFESNEAHCLTNYWKWYYSSEPYTIASRYHDKYEPYVIVERAASLPAYSELLVNYGMNKVMHASELFAAGYHFTVLPDLWAIHTPHRPSAYYVDFLTNLEARLRNRAARFHVLAAILERYRVPLKECEKMTASPPR